MARLIYSALMSLDGYIADATGHFEWTPLVVRAQRRLVRLHATRLWHIPVPAGHPLTRGSGHAAKAYAAAV
jgi:hypothetical protein